MGVDFTATFDHDPAAERFTALPELLNAHWQLPRELAPWVGQYVRGGPDVWQWGPAPYLRDALGALDGPHGFHGRVFGHAIEIVHLARWWSFLYEPQIRLGLRSACRQLASIVGGRHVLYLPDSLARPSHARDLIVNGGSVDDALKWLHSNVGEPISLSVALDHLDPDDPYGSSWFYEKMQPTLSVIDHVPGRELRLRTASSYSMNSTIAILEFLEDVMHAEIADASWKRGYGLPVATAIRICIKDVDAGLVTDGSDLCIRRYSGDKRTFEELCAAIRGRFESAL